MTTENSDRTAVPITLYVVFHPQSKAARGIANALYAWFSLTDDAGDSLLGRMTGWLNRDKS